MAWTIEGIRIFVQDRTEGDKQIVAKLQPLVGGTVNHIFGYENDSYKLSATIVGDTDKAALKALARTGTTCTLVTPYGNVTVIVTEVNADQMNVIWQSLRTDLSCDSPVYKVTLGLIT